MAIADTKLKNFFIKQKIGAFDALKQNGKVSSQNAKTSPTNLKEAKSLNFSIDIDVNSPINNEAAEKTNVHLPLANHHETVSKPSFEQKLSVSKMQANAQQSVSKPLASHNDTVSTGLAKPLADNYNVPTLSRIAYQVNLYSSKERDLLLIIFSECNSNASLMTRLIGTSELLELLKISAERLRNLIFRIHKKGGLNIIMSKAGRDASISGLLTSIPCQGHQSYTASHACWPHEIVAHSVFFIPLANHRKTVSIPFTR